MTLARARKCFLCIFILGWMLSAALAGAAPPTKEKPKNQVKAGQQKKPVKQAFGFKDIVEKARILSEAPYDDPKGKLKLPAITAEQHRDISFVSDKACWRKDNLPFELQFFHTGWYYDRAVIINEVVPLRVAPIRFSTDYFKYERSASDVKELAQKEMGFAGFRIHGFLNTASHKDEFAVFLGASYFRGIGQNMRYGLSARGLALDTAQPAGEEFPWFREFWIVKPQPKETKITVYALLDSPRATGAYKFVITPGTSTLMDVESTLFLRKGIEKIGIAPMTSMFFYGENTNSRPRDWYRPEIHDSDGLMINMENGEWLWRPICNPKTLLVNAFQADNLKGFGLMQRDIDFDHYQDLDARFDLRPSLWCTPKSGFGKGTIELVQIPTQDEIHDNIVAYWRPAGVPVGQPVSFAYSLSWQFPEKNMPPGGRVVATRTETDKSIKKISIDFEGGELAGLKVDDGVEGIIDIAPGARLMDQQVLKNPVTGGWRLEFQVKAEENPTLAEKIMPDKKPIVEMRAFLRRGTNILTETWLSGYQL